MPTTTWPPPYVPPTDPKPQHQTPPATGPPNPPTDRRTAWATVGALLVAGVLVDVAVQSRASGLAAFGAAAATALAIAAFGPATTRLSRVVLAAALLPAAFLPVRASLWLQLPNVIACLGLLAVGAGLARRAGLRRLSFVRLLRNLLLAIAGIMLAPARLIGLGRALRSTSGPATNRPALWRGLALAALPTIGLALLLASADAMFASMFHVTIDPVPLIGHGVVVIVAAIGVLGLIVHAGTGDPADDLGGGPRLGSTEANVVLAGLASVTALFALSRVLTALRGAEHVAEQTGLSYADYARSGFFQLLWAAALVVLVLLGLRSVTECRSTSARRTFPALNVVVVALMLVVVQTAIGRLALYEAAFGSTMLRTYCTVVAWWLGAVFVLIAVAAVAGRAAAWVPVAVITSALVVVVGLNVVNPERVVVERNAAHERALDADYVLSLSADSVPALVESLPRLDSIERVVVLNRLCAIEPAEPAPWNLADHRARQAIDAACR